MARRRTIAVSQELMTTMFRTGNRIEATDVVRGLPDDAKVQNVYRKLDGSNDFVFVITSGSFDDVSVPLGMEYPRMDVVFERVEPTAVLDAYAALDGLLHGRKPDESDVRALDALGRLLGHPPLDPPIALGESGSGAASAS